METEQQKQQSPKKINASSVIAMIAGVAMIGTGAWFWKNPKAESSQGVKKNIENSVEQENAKLKQEVDGLRELVDAKEVDGNATLPDQIPNEKKTNQVSAEKTEGAYEDGTYSAAGDYTSPAGAEKVEVSLTLKNNEITDTQFTGTATNPASKKWQDTFSTGYKEKVIGKSLSELSLTAVSGASLATKGFMDAVEKIKQQANRN